MKYEFLGWLNHVGALALLRDELKTALNSNDPAVRMAAIQLLGKYKHPAALTLLLTALEDPLPSHRSAAVRAVGDNEEEPAVRWLLRMFADPAPEVLCALTDAFAYYYREEEAVIQRKYLAVPYLIRALPATFSPGALLRDRGAG